MSETSDALKVIVVTPEETVVETTADSLVLPLFDGEIGILKGHSPMIGRLGYGEMRLKSGSEEHSYYVDGGFVQVTDNLVSVLTDRAMPVDQIDAEAAQKQLTEGLDRKTSSPAEQDLRDRTVSQARAQIRLATKSK